MPATATLKNISKQPVTVILDHPAFHNSDDGWKRSAATFGKSLEGGGRENVEVRRAHPGAITLLPGESKTGLSLAINKCSQVPNLISARVLSLAIVDVTLAQEKNAK